MTKQSVCAAFTLNGRIAAANGPHVPMALWVFVSAIVSSGDFSPARYIRDPSRPTTVLCAPLFGSIVASTSPVSPPTTFQMSLSKEGT